MRRTLRELVRQRANFRCEYCRVPEQLSTHQFEIDHIRARKHHGRTVFSNTCFSCARCNGAKGPNVAGFDPDTEDLVPLFNPRSDDWRDHFCWEGPVLVGLTAVGRVTIDVLNINEEDRLDQRQQLLRLGVRFDE